VRWKVVGPILALLVAGIAGVALSRPDDGAPASRDPEPVEVTSDAPQATSLEELTASADLIVRGEVTATERGRLFGEPGGAGVESRLVTLQVAEVLAGTPPAGSTVLIEEEGWLEDGTPLIVDGAAPSAVGDDGIWFLTEVESGAAPVYVVVSAQGRYLVDGGSLRGAAGDDPLIAELGGLTADELMEQVAALPARSE
jgi:hypothetical protein